MNWYLTCLRKYFVFSGRARRKEYWFFALFNFIFAFAAGTIDLILNTVGFFSGIYYLAIFIPSLAVTIRRLHDTSRSGWWLLIVFIPIIGAITLFIFMLLDSKPETNKYGANPKATNFQVL